MDANLRKLAEAIAHSTSTVAFTGAGISTESGIPDFRSPGGVWTKFRTIQYDEFVASPAARVEYWQMKRELFLQCREAKPNAGHLALAQWEAAGRLRAVITQNIDGLHQDAGSRNVIEIHGTGRYVECLDCPRRWRAEKIFALWDETRASEDKGNEPIGASLRDGVPICDCSGILKPATVMFGQQMPEGALGSAQQLAEDADVFLAIGSSLVVYPAAALPALARRRGAFLAIINRDPTPFDPDADVVIRGSIGEGLEAIGATLA